MGTLAELVANLLEDSTVVQAFDAAAGLGRLRALAAECTAPTYRVPQPRIVMHPSEWARYEQLMQGLEDPPDPPAPAPPWKGPGSFVRHLATLEA